MLITINGVLFLLYLLMVLITSITSIIVFAKLYSQSFPNSYAGLTLSFPIFEGGKRKYDIQQSEWELKRTDLDLVNLKNPGQFRI